MGPGEGGDGLLKPLGTPLGRSPLHSLDPPQYLGPGPSRPLWSPSSCPRPLSPAAGQLE